MSKLTGTLVGAAVGAAASYAEILSRRVSKNECEPILKAANSACARSDPKAPPGVVNYVPGCSADPKLLSEYEACRKRHPAAYREEGADGGFGAAVVFVTQLAMPVLFGAMLGFALSDSSQ